MSDEGAGFGPGEKVPPQVRILASGESLGVLRSVHRAANWLGKLQFRGARVYVFDQGLVLSYRDGASLRLFRVGQMRIRNTNDRVFQLAGPQGRAGFVTGQWSDGPALAAALTRWSAEHSW